jgi:hypothetical protein
MFTFKQLITSLPALTIAKSLFWFTVITVGISFAVARPNAEVLSTEQSRENFIKKYTTIFDKESFFSVISIEYKCSLMKVKYKITIDKSIVNQETDIYEDLKSDPIGQIDYFYLGNKKTICNPNIYSVYEFMTAISQDHVEEFTYTKYKNPLYSKYRPDELSEITHGIIEDIVKEVASDMTLKDMVQKKHLFDDKVVTLVKSKCEKYGIKVDLIIGNLSMSHVN